MAQSPASFLRRIGPQRLFLLFVLAGVAYTFVIAGAMWPWLGPAIRYAKPPQRLTIPVDGVRRGELQSTWGAKRSEGRKHQGADIFAARGTRVVSSTRGVVWKVGMDRLGGRVVTVLGEGPAFYYYAHLEDWAEGLARGAEVKPGDLLGYVGNSGNAKTTPPHLHFGVYRIGLTGIRAADPVPLLERTSNPFGG